MQRRRSISQQRRGSSASGRDAHLDVTTRRSRSRRGSAASRSSRSASRPRSSSRRGSAASRTVGLEDLENFLRSIRMEEHLNLLVDAGFSSLEVLSYAKVSDLEDLGLLKGHAVIIARAPKGPSKMVHPFALRNENGSDTEDSPSGAAAASDFQLKEVVPIRCCTQPPDARNYAPKVLAGGDGKITLWRPGSVINYMILENCHEYDGVPRGDDLQEYVNTCIKLAEIAWLDQKVGVIFEEVFQEEQATFIVKYTPGDPHSKAAARSFFPEEYDRRNPQFVHIFKRGLETDYAYDLLEKSIIHEFGHVLGLRHEYKLEDAEDPNDPARRFGQKDRNSIMQPELQPGMDISKADARYTRLLYAKRNGHIIREFPIVHKDPERLPRYP